MVVRRFFGLVRALLVVIGFSLVASGIKTVVSMDPVPPTSDGFLHGLAYLSSLILGVAGLLVIQIGYGLPAGIGRFRVGPLADRSAGVRCGFVTVVYFTTAMLMVYGLPMIFPNITGSTIYATIFLFFVISAVFGLVLTLLVVLGGLLVRTYQRQTSDDKHRPQLDN